MVKYLNNLNTKIIINKKQKKKKLVIIYLFGVLYSLLKEKKKLYLKLHFSFNLYLKIPKTIQIYILKKRLIVYGDKRYLKEFILNFISFRRPNIYTGIGMREKNDTYITKPGKIRKR